MLQERLQPDRRSRDSLAATDKRRRLLFSSFALLG
jgi:hypothetical protein